MPLRRRGCGGGAAGRARCGPGRARRHRGEGPRPGDDDLRVARRGQQRARSSTRRTPPSYPRRSTSSRKRCCQLEEAAATDCEPTNRQAPLPAPPRAASRWTKEPWAVSSSSSSGASSRCTGRRSSSASRWTAAAGAGGRGAGCGGRGRGHHPLGVGGGLALEPVRRVADLDAAAGRRAVDRPAALLDDVGQLVGEHRPAGVGRRGRTCPAGRRCSTRRCRRARSPPARTVRGARRRARDVAEVVRRAGPPCPRGRRARAAGRPELTTSCTGDGSSSTIELTALLPAARCRPISPASPSTSVRPSAAARPTWSVTGSSIRDALGRRPASSASNWCSRMAHSSDAEVCTPASAAADADGEGRGHAPRVQARLPERAAAGAGLSPAAGPGSGRTPAPAPAGRACGTPARPPR